MDWTWALDGQIGISLNLWYKKFIQAVNIRETVDCETPNRKAMSCSNKLHRRRHIVMKNSFMGDRACWVFVRPILDALFIDEPEVVYSIPEKSKAD